MSEAGQEDAAAGARRIAVLCGGRSHERAVSLRTGARVADAIEELGMEPELVDVGPDTTRVLRDGDWDAAFVALHGRGGEDGAIQSLLELVGVPYTGSRPGPCEAAFDKARAKRLLQAAGVPTPAFLTLAEAALEEFGAADALGEARETVGFPLWVKPVHGGSARGVRHVADTRELPRALIAAMSYDRHVLVERHVAGREVSVAVLGEGDTAHALPGVRIVPRRSDWFDVESRYTPGETEFGCPPEDLDEAERERLAEVAVEAYRALDCTGFGRVDCIVDQDGTPWVLEVATVPGLTDTSLVPIALEAIGMTLADLVRDLLDDALERDAERRADSEWNGD